MLLCVTFVLSPKQTSEKLKFLCIEVMFTLIYTELFPDFPAYQTLLWESFLSQVAYLCVHFTMDWCLKRFPHHTMHELQLWDPQRAINIWHPSKDTLKGNQRARNSACTVSKLIHCGMHRATFLLFSCVMFFKLCRKAEMLWMTCSHSQLHLYFQTLYVNNFLTSRLVPFSLSSVFMPSTGLFKLLNSLNILTWWQETLFQMGFHYAVSVYNT